jgi:uncharacterized protein YegL
MNNSINDKLTTESVKETSVATTETESPIQHVIFFLDVSGSMKRLWDDVITQFNDFLEKHQKDDPELLFTLITFNNVSTVIIDRKPIKDVELLSRDVYKPSGTTAMREALCTHLTSYRDMVPCLQSLVVIFTDGHDTSSAQEFTSARVKSLMDGLKEIDWKCVFIASNQDAVLSGSELSVNVDHCSTFSNDHTGVSSAFANISTSVRSSRRGEEIKLEPCHEMVVIPKIKMLRALPLVVSAPGILYDAAAPEFDPMSSSLKRCFSETFALPPMAAIVDVDEERSRKRKRKPVVLE